MFGIAFVTGDNPPAQHGLHRAGHHLHADAQFGGLDAVHLDAQLRLVESQVDIRRENAGVLGHFIKKLARHTVEVFVAVGGLDHKVQRTLAKALTKRGRRDGKCIDSGYAAEFGPQFTRNLQRGAVALGPIHRPVHHRALGHGRIADVGKDTIELGIGLPHAFEGPGVTVGVIQGRTIGCRDRAQNHSPVLEGCELLLHGRIDPGDQAGADQHEDDHHPASA